MSFTRKKFKKKRTSTYTHKQRRKGGFPALSKLLYRQYGGGFTGTFVSVNRNIPAGTTAYNLDPSLVTLITVAGSDIPNARNSNAYAGPDSMNGFAAVTAGTSATTAKLPLITSVTTDSAGNMYASSLKFIVKIKSVTREQLYTLDESDPTAKPIPIYPGVGMPVNNVKTGWGTTSYPAGTPTIELLAGSLTLYAAPTTVGNVSQPNIRFYNLRKIIYDKKRNCLYAGDAGAQNTSGDSVVKIDLAVSPVTASILVNLTSYGAFGTMTFDTTGDFLFIGLMSNYKMVKYDLNGGTTTIITNGGTAIGGQAAFGVQPDIIVASDGSFFTANGQYRGICRVVVSGTTYVSTIIAGSNNPDAGQYNTLYTDNTLPLSATFSKSLGIAMDSKNNLYVFDGSTNAMTIYGIRLITFNKKADGITPDFSSINAVYTYFGGIYVQLYQIGPPQQNTLPPVDGGPTTATMLGSAHVPLNNYPTFSGMFIDKYDNMYIADQANSMVRAISYPYTNVVAQSYLDTAVLRVASAAVRASSAVAQVASSALEQSISGPRQSSAVAQKESHSLASSADAQKVSSAIVQKESSALASSADAQNVSSALAQYVSGSRESSAVAQKESHSLASSAKAQEVSSALTSSAVAQKESSAVAQQESHSRTSSAVAQKVSSAVAQYVSGSRESSAVAQKESHSIASSAVAQKDSSAVAQYMSGALSEYLAQQEQIYRKASSADAQNISSAKAQSASSALAQKESSAVAQDVSSAVAQSVSSALAQNVSSAKAQSVSSALAQKESSAVAQDVSSAVAQNVSSALAQSISSAKAQSVSSSIAQKDSSAVAQDVSSAVAQNVSSALAQRISGSRESSAVAQQESSAQYSSAVAQAVSSALAQNISGAQASSSVAQQESSAIASSAIAQIVSSAVAQNVSAALAQKASSAIASSAVAQNASSALGQTASSAFIQTASSAQEQGILADPVSTKNDIVALLRPLQLNLTKQVQTLYSMQSSISDKNAALQFIQGNMGDLYTYFTDLTNISLTILSIAPKYQDRSMQTRLYDNNIESQGYIKVYDSMRQHSVIIDAQQGYILNLVETPTTRKY